MTLTVERMEAAVQSMVNDREVATRVERAIASFQTRRMATVDRRWMIGGIIVGSGIVNIAQSLGHASGWW